MKRYLLFAGNQYYPIGGMHDLIGSFDDMEKARLFILDHQEKKGDLDWAHIYDSWSQETVEAKSIEFKMVFV